MMSAKEFDVDYWEDVWEDVPIPQEKTPEAEHEIHRVLSGLMPQRDLRLIEIGCAPGGWLAYFHRQFRFSVSGIERAGKAYSKTIDNLKHLNIPAEILNADLFEFEHEPYDIVFSSGFIEHFEDPRVPVEKIVGLGKPNGGIVVTTIPSMQGLNRWISTTFRPDVATGHFPISKERLESIHEDCGLLTLHSDYFGSLHILPPIEKNAFSREHRRMSWLLNSPFRAWNNTISLLTKKSGLYPRCGSACRGIMYVGKRR